MATTNFYRKIVYGTLSLIHRYVPISPEPGINYGNEDLPPAVCVDETVMYVTANGSQTRQDSSVHHEITVPAGVNGMLVSAEGQNCRITIDGTTSTTTNGFRIIKDLNPYLIGVAGVTTVSLCGEAGGGFLNYQFVQ